MADTVANTTAYTDELAGGVAVLFDLIVSGQPSWHADAACAEHPEVNFFPEQGEDWRPAVAVCNGCLVQAECLLWAVDNGPLDGVWGGTTRRQRKRAARPFKT